MLFLILLSSVELCFDDVTVESGSTKMRVITGFDIFFTVAFGVEVIWQDTQLVSSLSSAAQSNVAFDSFDRP